MPIDHQPNTPPDPVPGPPPPPPSFLARAMVHAQSACTWLHGFAAFVIGGTANVLYEHYSDPTKFDLSPSGLHAMGHAAGGAAAFTVIAYFAQSPLKKSK
jgi:hypothetical protein